MENNNYLDFKKLVAEKFEKSGIDEIADFDWICCEVTGKKRSTIHKRIFKK